MITQERLKELLHYDPETGVFTWLKLSNMTHKTKVGWVAGSINNRGYRLIKVGSIRTTAHRLAFLYMTGEIPEQCDHINHIRDDNRWSNIVPSTNKLNHKNRTMPKNNTSGFTGVTKTDHGRYKARIRVEGKLIYLGTFKEKENAITARKKANIKYGFHKNHGQKR